jgi:ABC-type uncharacterized transport system substrate-binding protein
VGASDPVARGIVARLDRPGGNVTGFAFLEASMEGKWLELLSEIAPGLKRAAIMFNSRHGPLSFMIILLSSRSRSISTIGTTN